MADNKPVDMATRRNSLAGFQGVVTKRQNYLMAARDLNKDKPSKMTLDLVQKRIADLEVSLQRFRDATATAMLTDVERREVNASALDRIEEECMELILTASCADYVAPTPAPAPPAQAAQAGQHLPRVASALKPELLTMDHTPAELRTWKEAFHAYYEASSLQLHPARSQMAYFWSCVETRLQTRLKDTIQPDTAVMGEASCMTAIEEFFKVQYPVFLRRLDFFRDSQASGERWAEYAARQASLASEADLTALTLPQILVFRNIMGTTDRELQERFLRLVEPTLDGLAREAASFEGAKHSQGRLDGTASVNAVSNYKRGRSPSRPRPGKWPVDADGVSMEGRCWCCGKRNHTRATCPTAASTKCGKCDGRHVTFVCGKGQGYEGPERRSANRARSSTPPAYRQHSVSTIRYQMRSVRQSHGTGMSTPGLAVRCTHSRTGRSFEHVSTPDTGATTTVVALDLMQQHRIPFRQAGPKLYNASGDEMACEGAATLVFTTKDCPEGAVVEVMVSSAVSNEVLISWHDLQHLGSISIKFPRRDDRGLVASVRERKCVSFAPQESSAAVPSAQPRKPALAESPSTATASGKAGGCSAEEAAAPDLASDRSTSGSMPGASPEVEALKTRMKEEFADVFADELGTKMLAGEPMKIYLRESEEPPFKQLTARPVGAHLREEADEVVRQALESGVIVPMPDPSVFISSGFFVRKDNGKGKLRLVTDYTRLNERVQRPVHPFPSTTDVLRSIPPEDKYFAKLDLVAGYHQVPLDEEASRLTTFILPQGRFRYTRAPMGLSASSDEFCFRTDLAYTGLPIKKLVDDILIGAPTLQVLEDRIRQVLQRSREKGITISAKKLEIGASIGFAGHIVSAEGVRPHPDKLAALAEFPVPEDLTGVRSFLGLANQLCPFLPDLAAATPYLRQLLRSKVPFSWTPEHQREFEAARELLSTSPLLIKPFKMGLPTELLTDASRLYGLGYILLQREEDGKSVRLIQCGSRALNGAQGRYATIELELLGVQWAVHKCRHYLQGCPAFKVVTDHRPLVGLFKKHLQEIHNPRLQMLREKLMGYSFSAEWVQGKSHRIADALSRYPVFAAENDPVSGCGLQAGAGVGEGGSEPAVCRAVASRGDRDPLLAPLRKEAGVDSAYKELIQAVRTGVDPRRLPAGHPARQYASVFSRLSVDESAEGCLLVLDGHRLVVPSGSRGQILRMLHLPHSGLTKTRTAAQQLYFWPGMSAAISSTVDACMECQRQRPSLPRQPELDPVRTEAAGPMDAVAADLFEEAGVHYLVAVDRYSGWPTLCRLVSLKTAAVVARLTDWFNVFGFPRRMRTDGGPQFRGEFVRFCEERGIVHELTSPYNAESNGLAEAAVKSMKGLVKRCRPAELGTALAEWRNSPRADGISPAELFLGRRIRGRLPCLPQPEVNRPVAEAARRESRERSRRYNDRHTRQQLPLPEGQRVFLQCPKSGRWSEEATVVSARDSGRSYVLLRDSGASTIRNRRFIRPRDGQ